MTNYDTLCGVWITGSAEGAYEEQWGYFNVMSSITFFVTGYRAWKETVSKGHVNETIMNEYNDESEKLMMSQNLVCQVLTLRECVLVCYVEIYIVIQSVNVELRDDYKSF